MTPRKKASEITLGFIGSGSTSKKNINSLLSDFVENNGGNATFIVPVTDATYNDGIGAVIDFAVDNEIPIEVVADKKATTARKFKDTIEAASKQHVVERISNKVVNLLEKASNPSLVVLWNDDDEEAAKAVDRAAEKSIQALDLTHGLDVIEFGDEEDEDAEDEYDEEEEAEDEADDEEEEEEEGEDEEEESDEYEDDDEEEDGEVGEGDLDALVETVVEGVIEALGPRFDAIEKALAGGGTNGSAGTAKRAKKAVARR